MKRSKHGFTLVELLVVIAIIAVLIAILLPTLQRARESSNNVVCQSNIRQIALGTLMYLGDNNQYFPPSIMYDVPTGTYLYWPTFLLPYVPNPNVYICPSRLIDGQLNCYSPNGNPWMFWNDEYAGQHPDPLTGSALGGPGGAGHFWGPTRDTIANIPHPSQVVMFTETTDEVPLQNVYTNLLMGDDSNFWSFDPTLPNDDGLYSGGRHFRKSVPGTLYAWGTDNMAMVDGSVLTGISMEYLVENAQPGAFYSFPFYASNRVSGYQTIPNFPSGPGVTAQFWTVPWW